jgi:hypothetical protein
VSFVVRQTASEKVNEVQPMESESAFNSNGRDHMDTNGSEDVKRYRRLLLRYVQSCMGGDRQGPI